MQLAHRKLRLMFQDPYQGGQERKFPKYQKNLQERISQEENNRKIRKVSHSPMKTGTHSWSALHVEIIFEFIHFLDVLFNIFNTCFFQTAKKFFFFF